jgi:hypothetical protein
MDMVGKKCLICFEEIKGVNFPDSTRPKNKDGSINKDQEYPAWVTPTLITECGCSAKGKNPKI